MCIRRRPNVPGALSDGRFHGFVGGGILVSCVRFPVAVLASVRLG